MKYSAIDNGITQFLSLEPLGVDGALSGSTFRYISVLPHVSFRERNIPQQTYKTKILHCTLEGIDAAGSAATWQVRSADIQHTFPRKRTCNSILVVLVLIVVT